ncbi:MAG: SH3 domain-containing protein, partial [Gammaproteobacteria bacterium]|nr:SH3 domain-containing protein [Gammaproteobacteria bacterium]
MRNILFALFTLAPLASSAGAAELPAVVHKPTADVYAQPRFDAPKLATLQRDTEVRISAQQGLWYQLLLSAGAPGFVRVNDVRVAYAGAEDGEANLRVLMGGKAGKGRV